MTMCSTPLSVSKITKTFKTGFLGVRRVRAVRGLNLSLKPGEIFGLLGPNGAGKTTTLKMVTGLIFPDAGEVEIFGQPASSSQAKRRMGFLPENPWFYDYLTAREFLHMVGSIFRLNKKTRVERVQTLLKQLGIAHAADLPLRKFSKGMLQRAGLAQALLNDPDLIVMDEPLSGLDPVGRRDLREIILSLKKRGKTLLFSSHILSDVEELCDRVAIMAKGRIRSMGTMETLLKRGVAGTEIDVHLKDPMPLAQLAQKMEFTWVSSLSGYRLEVPQSTDTQALLKGLLKAKIPILELRRHRRSLEELFMEKSEVDE